MAKKYETQMTAAEAAAKLADLGVQPDAHHEAMKRVWRDAGLPGSIGGDFLKEVREVMKPLVWGSPIDGVDEVYAAQQAEDPLVVDVPPPPEGGDTVESWGADQCPRCGGSGIQEDGGYCRGPTGLGEHRRAPCAAGARLEGEEANKAVGEVPVGEATGEGEEPEEGGDVATETMKRRERVARAAKAKGRAVPGSKDRDAEAELRKRYKHIKEVTEWGPTGRPARVRIECTLRLSSECEKKREIAVQDLFQVRSCVPCRKQRVKNDRAKAEPKKKAKK